MEIDKLDEAARKGMQDADRIADECSAFARLKKTELAQFQRALDKATEFQRVLDKATDFQRELEKATEFQRALEKSSLAEFQRALDKSSLTAFHRQIEKDAARIHAFFKDERMLAFDAIAKQAAEQCRLAVDNSAAFQATVAAQRYLDEQAAQWERIRNSLVHEQQPRVVSPPPVRYTIKAKVPKVRVTPQAKQEHIPAPTVEPKIEMPPVHWLASALDFLLTKGAFKRTVEPILVDIYDEYYERISNGEEWRAKWIVARGCLLVIWGQIERPFAAVSGWWTNMKG